jgi:two-component system, NtrC family, sensor kinase
VTATILILDDSLTVRMDLAEAFERAGFAVAPCASVADARAVLVERPVDVLILDVLLPDGDGVDFLAEVRAGSLSATAVALVLSTEAEVKDRVRGLQTGADEYVGKPYDVGYVVARTHELLRARAHGPDDETTVLVIDDSLTFREGLRQACEAAGYRVITAADGDEGLRVAASRRPAAIVVDGVLPGIDGPTVIRHIRLDAALRGTPCLLLTSSDDPGAELLALDAGADAFARKDQDAAVVLAKLAALVRRATTAQAGAETASLLGPKKILAVDDSLTYLHALADQLRAEGYDVVAASSGEEALELLAVQAVDCILLDLLMPGLGGEETCRRIKAAPVVRDVPLIILTSLEDRESMLSALAAGADDYIPKSDELVVLTARIRAQLRRKQFEDENRRIREELLCRELEAAEARAAREMAEARAVHVADLERKNQELEAFSFSVSHDLRAPLRTIDGFSRVLLEDYGDRLDDRGTDVLHRVRAATGRMAELIEDLLQLSRLGRAALDRRPLDLSAMARHVASGLVDKEPGRVVNYSIQDGMTAVGDRGLVHVVLENLLGNAWKFSANVAAPKVEFAEQIVDGRREFFVRDDGDGFDMRYADKLFRPFQRLHTDEEFPGTGIGLATVQRIIERHGGYVRAESTPGAGATFSFTIPSEGPG